MYASFCIVLATFLVDGDESQKPRIPSKSTPILATVTKVDVKDERVSFSWRWLEPLFGEVVIKDNMGGLRRIPKTWLVPVSRVGEFEMSSGYVLDYAGRPHEKKRALSLKAGETVVVVFGCSEVEPEHLRAISEKTIILVIPDPSPLTLQGIIKKTP